MKTLNNGMNVKNIISLIKDGEDIELDRESADQLCTTLINHSMAKGLPWMAQGKDELKHLGNHMTERCQFKGSTHILSVCFYGEKATASAITL